MDRNIKRGVKLQNRWLDEGFGKKIHDAFYHFSGRGFGRLTFFGLFLVLAFNSLAVTSIFGKDLTPAFKNSAILMSTASFFEAFISKNDFFTIMSFVALNIAPITIYLFIRKVALRNEVTAFLAALFFVISDSVNNQGMPIVVSLFNGDGAHVLIFSILPLFLLYLRSFIVSGVLAWGLLSAVGGAFISIISPFSLFNFLVIGVIITLAEGFKGQFRIKTARFIFISSFIFGLSFFWYFPNVITNPSTIERLNFALSFFWDVFPIFIPLFSVLGAILFLVFDRRENLSPVLTALLLTIVYNALYSVSNSIQANGIFVAQRYIMELAFTQSFLIALLISVSFNFTYAKGVEFLKGKSTKEVFLPAFGIIALAIALLTGLVFKIIENKELLDVKTVVSHPTVGLGQVERYPLFDPLSVFSTIVSIVSFLVLVYILKKYSLDLQTLKEQSKR